VGLKTNEIKEKEKQKGIHNDIKNSKKGRGNM
jgi:hypothetical protein